MSDTSVELMPMTQAQLDRMHALYRQGGKERGMAPHIVYSDPRCPHPGCEFSMQAIDFRLEAHGRDIHDPLVRAWWDDIGFVGRCPGCRHWVHFTIRGKRAVTEEEADRLPHLPVNWQAAAIIL